MCSFTGGAGGADCLAALHLLYMYVMPHEVAAASSHTSYRCPLLFQLDLPVIVQAMAGVGAHSHALSACMLLAPGLRASTVKVKLVLCQPWTPVHMSTSVSDEGTTEWRYASATG